MNSRVVDQTASPDEDAAGLVQGSLDGFEVHRFSDNLNSALVKKYNHKNGQKSREKAMENHQAQGIDKYKHSDLILIIFN